MDAPEGHQKLSPRSGLMYIEEDVWGYKKIWYKNSALLQLIQLSIASLFCTLTLPNPRNRNSTDLEWRKWQVMVSVMLLVVTLGRLVIQIAVLVMERSLFLHKRVLYLLYGLIKSFQTSIWLGLSMAAWQYMFKKNDERVTHMDKVLRYVNMIWMCLLVEATIWSLKNLIIKVYVYRFHVRNYFDRVRESLFSQYVIYKLSGPPKQEQKLNPKKHKNGIMIEHLVGMNRENISIWDMNRMMNFVGTTMLTTLVEDFKQIKSESQAKDVARKIFCNVAKPDLNHIDHEDLLRFLSYDEASNIIQLFDGARTKGISNKALKNWVVNVFRERRALALSIEDMKSVTDKVHQMLNVVVGIIVLMIWLLILELETTKFFNFLCSILVLVSVVYGSTCKATFEGLMFLFTVHPFDVGDPCEIDGVQMTVEKMNILTTIFLRYDNQEIMYPNSALSTLSITNHRRSPNIDESIDFCVIKSTSPEKVAKVEEMLKSYVENKGDHWQLMPRMMLRDDAELKQLKISLRFSHHINYMDKSWKKRTVLIEEMINIFTYLDMEYNMLPMKINAGNLPVIASNRFPSNWCAH